MLSFFRNCVIIFYLFWVSPYFLRRAQLFSGQDEESPLVYIVRAGDAACGKRHLERKPLF